MDTHWMGQGKCRDMNPALFFPSDWIGVQSAQRICADCTVRLPCLTYALANRVDDGVWGGTSERQRKRLLRQHRSTRAVCAELSNFEPAHRKL
jgi:WhiB family transcriptional regulator, redox-sensing transcriptional regulator